MHKGNVRPGSLVKSHDYTNLKEALHRYKSKNYALSPGPTTYKKAQNLNPSQ